MFPFAHLFLGLIIGKLSGFYIIALIGAVLIDLDHLIAYARHKVLFKPKKLWKTITASKDLLGGQRNFPHSFITWLIISLIIILINVEIGLVFSLAYLSHLMLDMFDNGDFYLFYPFKKFKFKGPMKYLSKEEFAFTLILLLIFVLI